MKLEVGDLIFGHTSLASHVCFEKLPLIGIIIKTNVGMFGGHECCLCKWIVGMSHCTQLYMDTDLLVFSKKPQKIKHNERK